jgi:hypothetical protein
MYVSKRVAVAMLAASALAGSASAAVTALAHDGRDDGAMNHHGRGDRLVLDSSLAPSVPTDNPLLGTVAGGVPWVIRTSSQAKLHSDGRMTVRIRGLLIPSGQFAGTTGPVMTVSASLYCDGNSTPVGTSNAVPLSSEGNARIRTSLALPAKCLIPAVLIHPNGALGTYIATSGFGG